MDYQNEVKKLKVLQKALTSLKKAKKEEAKALSTYESKKNKRKEIEEEYKKTIESLGLTDEKKPQE